MKRGSKGSLVKYCGSKHSEMMPHVTIVSTLTLAKEKINVEARKGCGLMLFKMAPLALISDIGENWRKVLMAPKDVTPELPPISSLEFIDTHFGKELLADKNFKNYNYLFYLVEKVEASFADEEDILEDDVEDPHLQPPHKLEHYERRKEFLHGVLHRGCLLCLPRVCSPAVPRMAQPNGGPIHVLFVALLVHRYQCHISPICTHFYPVIYRAIASEDMLRITEAIRKDIALMGACWYFDQATIIRVEGTLTSPIILPPYVPNRLAALEVARQCYFGVAKRCKATNHRPYIHLSFKIGDVYFQNWPSLEKVAREIATMNPNVRARMRQWDPNGRVRTFEDNPGQG
eukprot:Gb_09786 [translate_table: standard]